MSSLPFTGRVSDLGEYLKEQRQNARLSVRQLATAAGVSNPYLSQIERGLRRPSAEVLQQIAKGLQISAEALFMRAGLLEDSPGVEVEVAIQSDLNLTARQKRVLLDIYLTFRAENGRESGGEAEPATPRGTRRGTRTSKKAIAARASRDTTGVNPGVAPADGDSPRKRPRPTKGAERPARVRRT